jgi:Phosphotransferase system cellobiose-specific component IIA
MNEEKTIFHFITFAGSARSYCLEALNLASRNSFKEAKEKLNIARDYEKKASELQQELFATKTIKSEKSMIMFAHAQDHLMSAITICELTYHLLTCYEKFYQIQKK